MQAVGYVVQRRGADGHDLAEIVQIDGRRRSGSRIGQAKVLLDIAARRRGQGVDLARSVDAGQIASQSQRWACIAGAIERLSLDLAALGPADREAAIWKGQDVRAAGGADVDQGHSR